MTQKLLIESWIREYGSITPAKMAGRIYRGIMFGSETSKRCREMRKAGILKSVSDGKFEVYSLTVERPVFNTSSIKLTHA